MQIQRLLMVLCFLCLATDLRAWPPSEQDREHWQALCVSGNCKALRKLLDNLAEQGEPVRGWVSMVLNHHGETPLHVAVEHDHGPLVALLLALGAAVNALSTVDRTTPLQRAIRRGNRLLILVLLQGGARFLENSLSDRGQSINLANMHGHADCAQWLMSVMDYQETQVAYRRRSWWVRLFGCGVQYLPEDPYQETNLHRHTRCGDTTAIGSCLRLSPRQLRVKRADGCTPLHIAVLHGQLPAMALLLMADIHYTMRSFWITNLQGCTPWLMAARSGQTDMVTYLSNFFFQGSTPLHIAAERNHVALVILLLKQELHPDMKRWSDNATALHLAGREGHSAVVAHLLLAGADPSSLNADGETPLDLAQAHLDDQHLAIQLLESAQDSFFVVLGMLCSEALESQ